MADTFLRRTPIQLLLLGAVLFLSASAFPPFVISQMRPIEIGLSMELSTRPAPTMLLDTGLDGRAELPGESQGSRGCRSGDPVQIPDSCEVRTLETRQVTTLRTSNAPKRGDVNVEALIQLQTGTEVLTEIDDVLRLDRRSTYPVSAPVSHLKVSGTHLSSDVDDEEFVREGLQYFFPLPTSRESYAWYDLNARQPLWLDYVGEVRHNDLDTFEFHHTLTAVELPDDEHGDTGTLWYSVRRTVWVEPESGIIVDLRAEPHLYYADDTQQAEERAFAPSPDYSFFHTTTAWDDETLAREHDRAASAVATLRVLQIFAVLFKTLALVVVVWAVVLLLRERRELWNR